MEDRQETLTKMFLAFPTLATVPEAQATMMMATFLETTLDFSSEVLSAACSALRRRPGQWTPSAGDLYAECEKQQRAKEVRDHVSSPDFRRPALTFAQQALEPQPQYSEAELNDPRVLINHRSASRGGRYHMRTPAFYAAHGIPPERAYGWLTPAEAAWVKENTMRKQPAPVVPPRPFNEAAEQL